MSTWGQIRLTLQEAAPGVSTDLVDEYIGARYGFILDHYPWKGLEEESMFESTASYNTGTVALVQGSNGVTGTGTAWTEAMTGLRFRAAPDNAAYVFTYVSATSGTLDRNYEAWSNPTSSYWIFQDEYAMPADCKTVLSVTNPITGLALADWTKKEKIESAYWLRNPGICEAWCMAADTSEASPPVLHVLQLIPAPMFAQGFPIRYQKAAYGFTGENTGAAPLPWVSAKCIQDGVRADIQLYLKDKDGAEGYEAKFLQDLAEMVRLDGVRRGQPEIRMPAHYVAYRRRRLTR